MDEKKQHVDSYSLSNDQTDASEEISGGMKTPARERLRSERIDKSLDSIAKSIEGMGKRFDLIEERLDDLEVRRATKSPAEDIQEFLTELATNAPLIGMAGAQTVHTMAPPIKQIAEALRQEFGQLFSDLEEHHNQVLANQVYTISEAMTRGVVENLGPLLPDLEA